MADDFGVIEPAINAFLQEQGFHSSLEIETTAPSKYWWIMVTGIVPTKIATIEMCDDIIYLHVLIPHEYIAYDEGQTLRGAGHTRSVYEKFDLFDPESFDKLAETLRLWKKNSTERSWSASLLNSTPTTLAPR